MRSMKYLLILVLSALLLAACAAPAEEEPEEEAPAEEAAEEEAPAEEADPVTDNIIEGRGGECLGEGEFIVDLECQEVTVAIENAYLPFNYVDVATGEAGGWDYDVIDEICTRLNCAPVYVEAAWEGMIQSVADGQFNMAADGITITEDRAEIVDFSDGYVNIEQRLMVRIDEDRFNSVDDFVAGDFTIGTQTGTTNFETATGLVDEGRIQAFEGFPFAVQALITGDVDAVIIDETAGQGYVGENEEDIKLIGESLSSDQLGFIFPPGSDLVDPFNQALQSMKDDGTLSEINTLYFGPDFAVTYDDIGPGAYAE